MSERDGGPAFPAHWKEYDRHDEPYFEEHFGMSLLDAAALCALIGFAANAQGGFDGAEDISISAWDTAEAWLVERERRKNGPETDR